MTRIVVARYGGLTLRDTGEAVGGLDYAAVSIAIKRLVRQAAANPTIRAQIRRLEQKQSVDSAEPTVVRFRT